MKMEAFLLAFPATVHRPRKNPSARIAAPVWYRGNVYYQVD
jgi:hypothetical protein